MSKELEEAINEAAANNNAAPKARNVYAKLMHVQQNLKSPKGRRNDYGKYSYRTAEDILQAVKPLLLDVQAVIVIADNIFNLGGNQSVTTTNPDGSAEDAPCNYVEATARFIDCESGEDVSAKAYARECVHKGMSADQSTGCASSYARKYALNALLCIDSGEDADSLGSNGGGSKPANNGGWGGSNNNGAPPQNNSNGWGNNGAPTQNNNSGWGNSNNNQNAAPAQNNGGNGNNGWGNSNNTPQSTAPQGNNNGWGNGGNNAPAQNSAPPQNNGGGWGNPNGNSQNAAPQNNGGGWGGNNAPVQSDSGSTTTSDDDDYPF